MTAKRCGVCFRPVTGPYRYLHFNIYANAVGATPVFIRSMRRRCHKFCKSTLRTSKPQPPRI